MKIKLFELNIDWNLKKLNKISSLVSVTDILRKS
jgi:hypothetical protein